MESAPNHWILIRSNLQAILRFGFAVRLCGADLKKLWFANITHVSERKGRVPENVGLIGKLGDELDNAIRANVVGGVERLTGLEAILADRIKKQELRVVGAVYDLRTGRVDLVT